MRLLHTYEQDENLWKCAKCDLVMVNPVRNTGQKRAEVVSNGSLIQVTRSAHLKSHTKQDPASETSQPLHQDGYSKQDRYVRHKIRLNILRTYVK